MNKNNWLHRLWCRLNFKWRKLGSYLACSLCSCVGSLQVLELPPNGVCALPWGFRNILFGRHSHQKLPVVLVWGSDQKAFCMFGEVFWTCPTWERVLQQTRTCWREPVLILPEELEYVVEEKESWRLCLDCYPRKWQNMDRKTNSKTCLFIFVVMGLRVVCCE